MRMLARALKTASHGLLIIGSLILSGCGGTTVAPSDPAKAVDALKSVLESWKSGETPEALASRTPSIQINDEDWKQGYKLLAYKTEDEGHLAGYDMLYKVTLELKGPKGKLVKKKAVYNVSTHPELFVLRQEG